VRLETLSAGGCLVTSVEAIQRFFDALTTQAESGRVEISKPAKKLSATRQKQIEAARRNLAAAGI
jgi:hypothetical protein